MFTKWASSCRDISAATSAPDPDAASQHLLDCRWTAADRWLRGTHRWSLSPGLLAEVLQAPDGPLRCWPLYLRQGDKLNTFLRIYHEWFLFVLRVQDRRVCLWFGPRCQLSASLVEECPDLRLECVDCMGWGQSHFLQLIYYWSFFCWKAAGIFSSYFSIKRSFKDNKLTKFLKNLKLATKIIIFLLI